MNKSNIPDTLDFPTVLASCLHDVKNSLCIFLGMLEEVVSETTVDDPRYNRMLKLQYEGQRIGNDMTQLLGIYRGSNAQLSPHIAEVEVADFLRGQVQVHEAMLEHKQIHADVVCNASLIGFFDQEMVAGILTNVINNAYKYTRSRLRLSGEAWEGGLMLRICDDGAGYPERMQANGDAGSSSLPPIDFSSGSTGLGLYFASLVAGLHKNKNRVGYIRITNDGIDGGGCFSLWLP